MSKTRNSLALCAALTASLLASTAAFAQTMVEVPAGSTVTTTTTTDTLATPVEKDVRNSTTTTTTVIQPAPMETVTVTETTIYGQQLAMMLKGEPKAKRFYNLVVTSGLGSTFNDSRGFTAFVPYDSAFAGSSVGTSHTPGIVDPAARELLQKHVSDGKFDVNLIHGTKDTVTTRSGDKIVVGKGQRDVYYANGVKIVDTLKTPQGIVYFVDKPIFK